MFSVNRTRTQKIILAMNKTTSTKRADLEKQVFSKLNVQAFRCNVRDFNMTTISINHQSQDKLSTFSLTHKTFRIIIINPLINLKCLATPAVGIYFEFSHCKVQAFFNSLPFNASPNLLDSF